MTRKITATKNGNSNVMPGADSFMYRAGDTGCLLIHGISGSPQVFRGTGRYLSGKGITAYGVRLRGHGTCVEDLHKCTYADWVDSAKEGLLELKKNCSTVFCVGLSMGAVISLRLARLYPGLVRGIVTVSCPYRLESFRFKLIPIAKKFIRKIPVGSPEINDPDAFEVNYQYHSVSAAHELIRLTDLVRCDLPLIKQPILIFSARHDKTVSTRDAGLIYCNIASEEKEVVWLEHSQHVAILDYDKELIHRKIYDFIKTHSA